MKAKPHAARARRQRARAAEIPERNRAALAWLRKWLADESGYQEAVWPKLKQAIEEDRLSYRKRFSE
jgi:hypothetical protein